MPLYKLFIKKSALKEINALPLSTVKKIDDAIEYLKINPRPPGVKKLVGQTNLYRIRITDYRVIYSIEDDILKVLVIKVGHRKDLYR